MDGTVIVNATNQLSDLYIQWNQTVHDLRKYYVIYAFFPSSFLCYTFFILFIQHIFYYLTCCLLCIFINFNIIMFIFRSQWFESSKYIA